jgi:proteic killer suppression protein
VEYFGASKKLTKLLSEPKKLQKEYGTVVAEKISKRLFEFEDAETLSDISHLPPPRLHQLSGDRKNQFAVDLTKNYRLIFEGYDAKDEETTDKGKIVTVVIIEIEDYH